LARLGAPGQQPQRRCLAGDDAQEASEVGQVLGVGLAGSRLLAAQEALDQAVGAGQRELQLRPEVF
jgi:hypothetical protein